MMESSFGERLFRFNVPSSLSGYLECLLRRKDVLADELTPDSIDAESF